jgi:hypothetical protein
MASTSFAHNLPLGSRWKMKDLTSSAGQKLNGKKCTLISIPVETSDRRMVVQVDGTKQQVKVRLTNLQRIKDKNARPKSQRLRDIHKRAVNIVKNIINTSPGSAKMDLEKNQVMERSLGFFTDSTEKSKLIQKNIVMHSGWHGGLNADDVLYQIEGSTWTPRLKHLYELRKLSITEFPGKEHNGHLAKRWFPNDARTDEISTLIELLIVSLLDSCELFARKTRNGSSQTSQTVQPCEIELSVQILDELACSNFDVNESVRDFIMNYCSKASRRHILSTLCTGLVPHFSPPLHGMFWSVGSGFEFVGRPQPGRMFGGAMVPSTSLHTVAMSIVAHCAMQSASRQIQLGRMTNLIGTLCNVLRVGAKNEETLHVSGGVNHFSISDSIKAAMALSNMVGRSTALTDQNLRTALQPNCGILESIISACCSWLNRFDSTPHNRIALDDGLIFKLSISFAAPLAWLTRLIGSFTMALFMHKFTLFNFEPEVRAKTFWSQVLAHEDCPNTVEQIEHVLLRVVALGLTDGADCHFKGHLLPKGDLSKDSPQAFMHTMSLLAYLHSGYPVGFASCPFDNISKPSKYGFNNDLEQVDDSILSSWFNDVVVDLSANEKKRKTLSDALSDLMIRLNSGSSHVIAGHVVAQFSEFMKINKKHIDRISGTNHLDLDLKKTHPRQFLKKDEGTCSVCLMATQKKCSCGTMRFCSVGCQKQAWPIHKVECKRIRKEKKKGGKKKEKEEKEG